MSRTTAIWSAAALTLFFALLVGAVLLRPLFVSGDAAPAEAAQPMVVVRSTGQPATADQAAEAMWAGDDDEDGDRQGEERRGHDDDEHEHEQGDEDDDD